LARRSLGRLACGTVLAFELLDIGSFYIYIYIYAVQASRELRVLAFNRLAI